MPSLSTQQQESYFKKYKKGAIFSIELKRPFSRIVSNAMEARSKRGRHVAHQIYGGMEFYTIEFNAFPWEFKSIATTFKAEQSIRELHGKCI